MTRPGIEMVTHLKSAFSVQIYIAKCTNELRIQNELLVQNTIFVQNITFSVKYTLVPTALLAN